ncbi:hypothetical protein [Legionella saoudiensis]|uniref:hypothetical protein n=1 Tax=Legionella saoudiensis TaxID=1750561 RepID=UPI00072FF9C8|nr:hypothetical protein [Legionella saoudiensis]
MLKNWQKKFPQCFKRHPNIFTELTSTSQEKLSVLLKELDESELLNEHTVNYLLNNATKSDECIELIAQMLKGGVAVEHIPNFMEKYIVADGLSRAITLFDLSSFNYHEEHLLKLSVLTQVLANPLCQTIFDARLRSFSDYTIPTEPLRPQDANRIIQQLCNLQHEESRIRTFFNFFAEFRPIPCSQDYLTEIDCADQVVRALELYCITKITAIRSYQDRMNMKEMILLLQKQGGNRIHFEAIKYQVASVLEEENWGSTKNYDQLMHEIWQALIQPQTALSDFSTLDKMRETPLITNTPTLLFLQQAPTDSMELQDNSEAYSMSQ